MGLMPERRYEDLLGDALEEMIAKGVDSLEAFVAGLNALYVGGPRGQTWTVELLAGELSRLGA